MNLNTCTNKEMKHTNVFKRIVYNHSIKLVIQVLYNSGLINQYSHQSETCTEGCHGYRKCTNLMFASLSPIQDR